MINSSHLISMESFFTNWIFAIGTFFVISIVISIFVAKQIFRPQNKNQDDKLLLKQLLEGFGLDVPPELNEIDPNVIKSIKAP